MTCNTGSAVLSVGSGAVVEALALHAASLCTTLTLARASVVLCGCNLYSSGTLTVLLQVGTPTLLGLCAYTGIAWRPMCWNESGWGITEVVWL